MTFGWLRGKGRDTSRQTEAAAGFRRVPEYGFLARRHLSLRMLQTLACNTGLAPGCTRLAAHRHYKKETHLSSWPSRDSRRVTLFEFRLSDTTNLMATFASCHSPVWKRPCVSDLSAVSTDQLYYSILAGQWKTGRPGAPRYVARRACPLALAAPRSYTAEQQAPAHPLVAVCKPGMVQHRMRPHL